ncbi:hypothetical protein BC941DRAFT_434450 [Chlamydoabsidia padenii]|nr:hypothetical protein BC941DRAFT_434450 [Chlamydoabsidia padenii]
MTTNQPSSRYIVSLCDLKSSFQTPPMISMKDHFYQCWLCVYGPVFWLLYMMTTSLELHWRHETLEKNTIMVFSFCDDLQKKGDDSMLITPPDLHTLKFNSDDSPSPSEDDDDTQSIQSNKTFKSTLKTRFQNLKLKQQSLNEAMKRSLLRKSSKSTLSDSTDDDYQDLISKKHPLSLEHHISLSDSLLKSINKKGKQPLMAATLSRNQCNEDLYVNSNRPLVSDGCIKGGEKHPAPFPYRRKTSPEITKLS